MRKRKRLDKMKAWVVGRKKLLLLLGTEILFVIISVQLFYPQERALPFAALHGNSVFWKERNEIAGTLHKDFLETTVTLETGDKNVDIPLGKMGATPNTEKMVDELIEYPLWQRLIPFSIIVKRPVVSEVNIYFDGTQLEGEAAKIAEKLTSQPTDARIEIENGGLKVTNAKPGFKVTKKDVQEALSKAHFDFKNTKIEVPASTLEPSRTDADIEAIIKQAEAIIAKKITVKGPDNSVFTPDKNIIASWLLVDINDSNQISLKTDMSRLESYANGINDQVKVDPGVANVNIVDGEVVAREGGSEGREVVISSLVGKLEQAVLSDKPAEEITVETRPVVAVEVSSRVYTSSQKGLQAYINYVTSVQDIRISLVQLDGNRWTAESRAHESTPSGSTFKVWVALVLFDKMQKGEIHWDDPMLDTTVAGCFERMTVASTNPCAESWIAQWGRQYINDFIYARGFSTGTNFFTNGVAISTTAADLTKYMIGLHTGSLVGGQYRDRLLDSLGRHPYRYGVPTGSAGIVHDKVGFLWDYVHDAAIVQHPRGTYVVTIMTRGQSYGRIAQITRELESIMYP